ncbi:hypothetical protein BH18VER1_BH18VER1_16310 [soil metagenome]
MPIARGTSRPNIDAGARGPPNLNFQAGDDENLEVE